MKAPQEPCVNECGRFRFRCVGDDAQHSNARQGAAQRHSASSLMAEREKLVLILFSFTWGEVLGGWGVSNSNTLSGTKTSRANINIS